jgi:hypothetical protein
VSASTVLRTDLEARYGVRRIRPWQRAIAALVGLVVLGSVLYAGWLITNPGITFNVLAFRMPSATRTVVTFDIQRPGDRTVVCVVRAQDINRHDVGYATVKIAPGAAYVQTTYPLATRAAASIVEVLGCGEDSAPHVAGPDFPPGTSNPPQIPAVAGG